MNKYFIIGVVIGFAMGLMTITIERVDEIKFYFDKGVTFFFGGL